MSKTNYDKVAEFNVVFDCKRFYNTTFDRENWISPDVEKVFKYRCDLIKEEGVIEFGKALQENNRVEMVDAICDSLYVLYGAAWTMGINIDYHFKQLFNTPTETTNFTVIKNEYMNYKDLNKTSETVIITRLTDLYVKFVNLESEFRKVMLSGDGEFDKVSTLLLVMIITTYKMGVILNVDVDEAFDKVHQSNMSKLCTSVEEALETVQKYEEEYKNGKSPYDSPYFYQKDKYYVVKNKSTGKVLKSINYKPVDLSTY